MRWQALRNPSQSSNWMLGLLLTLGITGALPGCGAPVREAKLPAPAAPEDSPGVNGVAETLLPESNSAADIDVLYPELRALDASYRATLQAIRDDDLPGAEEALNQLDSDLRAAQRDIGPPGSLYVESMSGRVERLRGLVHELREFQEELGRIEMPKDDEAAPQDDSVAVAELKVQAERKSPSGPRHDLDLVEHPLIDKWVRYFTGDGRHYMELWLSRQPLYEDFIYSVLDEYDVPRDLLYLAMIESGLSMKARSYANAVGPWQFISSTGRLYDLKIDWWVDERRDLEKSTRAAAHHLSDLYESLDSWPLALAAYNCGVRRVDRAVRRHRSRDFWKLTSLPRQTENYVPKFMAALRIGHDPEAYGFKIPDVDPLRYDTIQVEDATDLHLVAKLADTSLESLADLNPHLKRWSTPPGESYRIKVPRGSGDSVTIKLAAVPESERVRWRRHKVSRGETLAAIARDYGTSAEAIRQANNMRGQTIHPGNHLLIPVVGGDPGALAQESIAQAAKANTDDQSVYVVRRGDTLGRIAKRHGTSVSRLMEWNGKRSTRIHVGERLTMHGGAVEAAADDSQRHITYVVQRGDTLTIISARHRVSVGQLMNWNRKRSTRIHVGERLRIYVPG